MIQKLLALLALVLASTYQLACNGSETDYSSLKKETIMENNKRLVQQQWDKFNSGNLEDALKLYAPDIKNHGEVVGREGMMMVIGDIRHTFPDITFTTIDAFADGDWVTCRGMFKGTFKNKATVPHHGGLLMTHEPTYKSFEVQHIHIFKVVDNLITEHFACRDDIDMYQQLGVMPPPPSFEPPGN